MISVGLPETLEKAAAAIDWGGPRPKARPGKAIGRGIACMIEGTNTPRCVNCMASLRQDGRVPPHVGDMGTRPRTGETQATGARRPPQVVLSPRPRPPPPARYTPFDFGTTSSGSTFHMGNAVILACQKLLADLYARLSAHFGLPADAFSVADDRVRSADGSVDMPLAAALHAVLPRGGGHHRREHVHPGGDGHAQRPGPVSRSGARPSGCSPPMRPKWKWTWRRARSRSCAWRRPMMWARRSIPLHCVQQIEGSVIMGSSMALGEEYRYAEDGRVLTDTLLDYKIATSKDMPRHIEPILVESNIPLRHTGQRGGEPAAGCTPPAIVNAVHDAVGVWMTHLPMTPEKVLMAIRKHQGT